MISGKRGCGQQGVARESCTGREARKAETVYVTNTGPLTSAAWRRSSKSSTSIQRISQAAPVQSLTRRWPKIIQEELRNCGHSLTRKQLRSTVFCAVSNGPWAVCESFVEHSKVISSIESETVSKRWTWLCSRCTSQLSSHHGSRRERFMSAKSKESRGSC